MQPITPVPALSMIERAPTTSTPMLGRLEVRTRVGVIVLLVLAILNGAYLFLTPGLADTGYAWAIRPPAAAAFLGAGYLAGVVATALVAFGAERWRAVAPLAPALAVLSIALMAATLIHADRFRWDYPPTWGWVAVYTVAPILIAVAVARQRARTHRPRITDPSLDVLRALSLVAGLALLGGAVALFVAPADAGALWPWPLTPLLAQAVGAWMAMVATSLLWCAYDLRRRYEAFIPYTTLAAWCACLLAIPALHAGDLTRTGAPLVMYLGALVALLALAAFGVLRSDRNSI